MIALHGTDELEALRARLEEQYEGHTERLARLMGPERRGRGDRGGNPAAKAAAASSSRRALAEIAHALQRMADGTYGRCEGCAAVIPVAHLEQLPANRFCPSCR